MPQVIDVRTLPCGFKQKTPFATANLNLNRIPISKDGFPTDWRANVIQASLPAAIKIDNAGIELCELVEGFVVTRPLRSFFPAYVGAISRSRFPIGRIDLQVATSCRRVHTRLN